MRSSSSGSGSGSGVLGGRVVALLLAVLGAGIVLHALVGRTPDAGLSPAFEVLLGLVLLATAAVTWVVRGSPADPARRTELSELDGEPALVVALRPASPLVMVVVGTAFAALFAAAVFGVGVTDGGLLFSPLVLLFAALVPDGVRALVRRPRLVLGVDAVLLHGWTIDSRLAWEDVVTVQADTMDPRRARLLVVGRPDASSWRLNSHKLVLPMDRRPTMPEIAVPLSALDAGSRVEVLARRLAHSTREERRGYLDREGAAFLAKEM